MNEIKVSAKSLEEAITKACVELGVTSDNLDYSVLDKGSKGFFGLGARNCVIKAGKKAESPVAEKDQDEKPGEVWKERNKLSQNTEYAYTIDADIKQDSEGKELSIKKSRYGKKQRPEKPQDNTEGLKSERSESFKRQGKKRFENKRKVKENQYGVGQKERNKNATRKTGADNVKKQKNYPERGSSESKNKESRMARTKRERKTVVLKEDPVERAKNFLASLFEAMDINIDISGNYDAEKCELMINLSGEDVSCLVEGRGQTLDATQYICSQVVNKRQTGYIRVKLDTENYREKRKESLEKLAFDMAEKVKQNKRPMVLEAMNAYERRIIHAALQNVEAVTTHSEGEEPYRHVVIRPVKQKDVIKEKESPVDVADDKT